MNSSFSISIDYCTSEKRLTIVVPYRFGEFLKKFVKNAKGKYDIEEDGFLFGIVECSQGWRCSLVVKNKTTAEKIINLAVSYLIKA